MQKHQAGAQGQIAFYNECLKKAKAVYLRLFPKEGEKKPKWAMFCADKARSMVDRPHKRLQDAWFLEMQGKLLANKRAMVFLTPETDIVTGGIMSICNLASRSQGMKELHGCEVLLATLPGRHTISKYTRFENDWRIFRFEQIEGILGELEELFLQIPEVCVCPFLSWLETRPDLLGKVPARRLNILNQNVELMPGTKEVKALAGYFSYVTQTCAHTRYCTEAARELYGMPVHLLPADIPGRFYQIPYGEKENLIAYSDDENPYKEKTLEELKKRLPDYRFLMIQNMTYEEYRQTISRAKWTLTFGEGWDAYYLQPYASNSIGFTVFNEAFCPEYMRKIPTVFPDYETLPQQMAEFIRTFDREDLYSAKIGEIRGMLFPPPPPDVVPRDALLEFYKGNYTFP
ncbi:MAG: hypothetical protein HFE84_09235 [Lachnospiraceae bacterium]|nr:hypothetical protein [Lachnospiraceae bacterium]